MAYTHYRLNILENNGNTYVGIGELVLSNEVGNPSVHLPLTLGGTPSASSTGSIYTADRAFNDTYDSTSTWISSANPVYPQWLQFEFAQPQTIREYTIFQTKITTDVDLNNFQRSPKSWQLLGSNDGISWDVLDERSNETGWSMTADTDDPPFRLVYTVPTAIVANSDGSREIYSYGSLTWTSVKAGTVTKAVSSRTDIMSGFSYSINSAVRYGLYQTFIDFDTSSIPQSAVISDVRFVSYTNGSGTGTDERSESVVVSTSVSSALASIGTSSWDANVQNQTLLGDTIGVSLSPYNGFYAINWNTYEAFNNYINKGGNTRLMVTSKFALSTTAPGTTTAFRYYATNSSSQSTFGNDSVAPKLLITYSDAPSGFEHLDISNSGLINAASGSGNFLELSNSGYIRKAGTEGTNSLILDASGRIVTKGS